MLCIFNPEHDLCLANGNRHFMPPSSALLFAREGASIMQVVYPDAVAVPSIQAGQAYAALADGTGRQCAGCPAIVPWGWNITLKTQLLKAGIPAEAMPDDSRLDLWRQLQHRSTLLPLQPESRAVTLRDEVEEMLALHGDVVLKAPWSGSGRGLRWIGSRMTEHDIRWMDKVVREQRCVIAEPRRRVADDFALEYRVQGGRLLFVGYSLFQSEKGVYRSNLLLGDEAIAARTGFADREKTELEEWLTLHIAPHYEGPLGVDCIRTEDGVVFVSELNLRHTMGLVAHCYLQQHPEAEGRCLTLEGKRLCVAR